MIVTVSDTNSLWAAIKGAHSGDTIELAAGNYSLLKLYGMNPGGVTITSADPSHPAVIAGINISSSSGMTFSNLKVTTDPGTGFNLYLGSDQNIAFDHMDLQGLGVAQGSNAAMVRNSSNVSITNSDIHDLGTGINHLNSDHLNFSNNTIHNLESDGIRGGGSSYVTVSGNHFTDFFPTAADHPDAIQFWTTGTTTTTHDLTITNNVYVRGAGTQIQGIFVGNENQIPFENVTITGNAIIGGMYHGISLSYGDHVTVANNLVEGYSDMTSWIMLNNTTNSTEHDNQATTYAGTANLGLVTANDTTIAQGALGDLSTLNHWLSLPTVATGPDPFDSAPPTSLPPMTVDPGAILTAMQSAMTMNPYGGGWLL